MSLKNSVSLAISGDKKDQYISYICLAIGAILYTLSSGRWNIPLTAWLWPVFILHFVRTQKPVRGLITTAVILMIGANIKWIGVFSSAFYENAILYSLMGLVFIIPFLVDKILTNHLKGLLSTLVFPLSWTIFDYINSFCAFGSWGSIAYTQYGNLPLVQLVSVTGIFGLTFLISWFASVINLIWEEKFEWYRIKKVATTYTCILAGVMILGGARLALFPPTSETVRVASAFGPVIGEFSHSRATYSLEQNIDSMEISVEKSVLAGAKIINWNEEAFAINKDEENSFVGKACELAKENGVYMLLTIELVSGNSGELSNNKEVFIDPSGEVMWQYSKTHLVPLIEEPYFEKGDGNVPSADTEYGKISSVICYDLDFPSYVNAVGKAGADILLAPAWDWKAILPYHTPAATFRAIENGTSFIRNANKGLTLAVDYQGRVLTSVTSFNTDRTNNIIISDLPMKGVRTVYSIVGDLFDWLCCAGFMAIVVFVIINRKRKLNIPENVNGK